MISTVPLGKVIVGLPMKLASIAKLVGSVAPSVKAKLVQLPPLIVIPPGSLVPSRSAVPPVSYTHLTLPTKRIV